MNYLDEFREHAKKVSAPIEGVSNAIREVEDTIRDSNLMFQFDFQIYLDDVDPTSAWWLSWRKQTGANKSTNYRLCLIHANNEGDHIFNKPLIECKTDIRIKNYIFLKPFIKAYSKFLENKLK